MSSRRRAREAILQILYQAEVGRRPLEQVIADYTEGPVANERAPGFAWDEDTWRFIVRMAREAWEHREEADGLIAQYAEGWPLDRLARVDLAILRLALYELLHTDTPPAVAINEAVELAHRYGTEDSSRFINGILGRIYRERLALTGSSGRG
ncbi:MAG: transcription antitermination factor NusB [Armatimonadota bacterium]|nr:transcription antitermination factor NusB [Armatimonadota bacterium]MDR7440126.1 transcription antitermination factor NusB [Armatimonadota bacterium]MDR7562605.1 transcription antitermination factor NusB [Armatimonadota bacterium]MDR7568095.1 transcription antitermination factor NusB [Armatimonadota bacterium]MDR7602477.1 transcription antitermination factor NusB [Armatimonadota bacterium]